MTVLSLGPQSNLQEALQQLKQSTLIDWDNADSDAQFELLDQSYGYFMSVNEGKKKVLREVFSKLSMACQTMITLFEKTNDVNGRLANYYSYHLMALLLDPSEIIISLFSC